MHFHALSSAQKWLLAASAAAGLCAVTTPLIAQDDIPNAARLGYIQGNVSIEPAGVDSWGQAYPNLPIGPGDRIFTDETGRAEIQVGQTYVRVGPNSDITLTRESPVGIGFGLAQGTVYVHEYNLWPGQALQVHTPNANITTTDPERQFRVDTAPDQSYSIFTSFNQFVLVTGANGYSQLIGGDQTLQMNGQNPPYPQWLQPTGLDDFDQWSRQRDAVLAHVNSYQYVSPYIPGAYEMDAYGDWQPGTPYGAVWFPRNVAYGWAPYRYGHWVNHAPWGWMWVEDEPWGYAPFHYGRWVNVGGRWGWVPGPPAARPIFAPALVAFAGGISIGGGGVSVWFPLGPGEAYRPWYPCPPAYVDRVNISNITETNVVHVQKTYVNIVNVTNVTNVTYVNKTIGVTAVSQNDFASGRTVTQAQVKVAPEQIQHITVVEKPEVKPTQASFISHPPAKPVPVKAERPVLMNSEGKLEAAKPGAKPVEAPVRPVAAPKPVPGRVAAAPPPGAKPAPAPAGKPAGQPAAAPSRPAAQPAPAAKPEARPAPAPAKPETKAPEAAPKPAAPTPKPEAKPGPQAPKPEARPGEPAPKPEAKPGTPGAKPEDKNKKPEDKNKKPEEKKPE